MIGKHNWSTPTSIRKPINIAPIVRERLVELLFEPEMQGVGYSEFIKRAIDQAYSEIHKERDEEKEAGKEEEEPEQQVWEGGHNHPPGIAYYTGCPVCEPHGGNR